MAAGLSKIDVLLDLRMLAKFGLDLFPHCRRRKTIVFGEVEHHGAACGGKFVEVGIDTHAVVADRAIHIGAGGGEHRECAAHAIADCSDLARVLWQCPQRGDGGDDVLDGERQVEALVVRKRRCETRFAVAEHHAGLHAPEEIGHEHYVTFFGVAIGHRFHVVVDAEDLLQQHKSGAAALGRCRQIGLECAAVAGAYVDVLSIHAWILLSEDGVVLEVTIVFAADETLGLYSKARL
jgi:hypothetical protein